MIKRSLLQGTQLKKALEEYKSGEFSTKQLRKATLKGRQIFCTWLYKFLDSNGWVFDKKTANEFLEKIKTNQDGTKATLSSITSYISRLRAFNQFCVEHEYIKENFCKWISKPVFTETLPEPIHLQIKIETLYQAIFIGTTPTKYDTTKVSLHAKEESRVALLLMFHSGIRSGTTFNLKGEDLHFEGEIPYYMATMKGGKRIPLPIPQDKFLIKELKKRKNRERLFEVSPAVTISHLRRGLIKQGVNPKIANKVKNHTFRKAFAQERDRNDEPIQKIANALGDRVDTIEKYYLSHTYESLVGTVNNSKIINNNVPINENVVTALKKLRTIFSNKKYGEIKINTTGDKIIFEIPVN